MNEKLELKAKSTWDTANYEVLAAQFGYAYDDSFESAMSRFVKETVEPAKVTEYLAPLAQSYLVNYQPPLTRSNSRG